MDDLELNAPIRLVGAAAFDLIGQDAPLQTDLFGGKNQKQSELEKTLDKINEKLSVAVKRGADME